jgi:hypothetical protein
MARSDTDFVATGKRASICHCEAAIGLVEHSGNAPFCLCFLHPSGIKLERRFTGWLLCQRFA